MSDYQDRNIKNETFKGIPGDQITWRNMQGMSNGTYARPGNRYFAIKLDDDLANDLEEKGWPIIWRNINRDEDGPEEMQAYLKVFIKFGVPRYPVDIYLINSNMQSKVALTEDDIDKLGLDSKPIEFIDIVIRPYYWTYGDKKGVKAQLQAMNMLLSQNGLDDDYEIVYNN